MNNTMTETIPARSERHDNSTSHLGYDDSTAVFHGADGADRWMGGDARRRERPHESNPAYIEDDDRIMSPAIDRLMALGLPVYAWAAFGCMFLKVEMATMAMTLMGVSGVALITAAMVARKIRRENG